MSRWLLILAAWLLIASAQAEAPARIAAASDLRFALDQMLAEYQGESGGANLSVVYGSSGNFARQIERGAPFSLYFSADEAYVARLAEQGLTHDAGDRYAVGRLALVDRGKLGESLTLEGLAEHWPAGRLRRFAIANPEHAPYGVAARQVLQSLDLYRAEPVQLVLGENVAQAAQYIRGGSVDAGLVAYSLVRGEGFMQPGMRHYLVPAEHHAALNQRMVRLKHGSARQQAAVDGFYQFVLSERGQAILADFGFEPPGTG